MLPGGSVQFKGRYCGNSFRASFSLFSPASIRCHLRIALIGCTAVRAEADMLRNRTFWAAIFVACAILTRHPSLLPGAGAKLAGPGANVAAARQLHRPGDNSTATQRPTGESFLQEVISKFGADGELSREQLQQLLSQVGAKVKITPCVRAVTCRPRFVGFVFICGGHAPIVGDSPSISMR